MRIAFLALGVAQWILAGSLFRRPLYERRWFRWLLVAVFVVSGTLWLWFGVRDLLAVEVSGLVPRVEAADQGGPLLTLLSERVYLRSP